MPSGPGGYVGAIAKAVLLGQFGPLGSLLILVSAGLVGLAMCYDVLLVWPAQEIGLVLRAVAGRLGRDRTSFPSPPSPTTCTRAFLRASIRRPIGRPSLGRCAITSCDPTS